MTKLPCPTCGTIDTPAVSPGTPPHGRRASCRHCGGFIRWLPKQRRSPVYMNDVFLAGTLARTPEVKETDKGVQVTHGVILLEDESDDGRSFKTYVPIISWGRSAEVLAGLQQGDAVLVKGRLRYRSWKDKDGKKVGRLEVSSFQVQAVPVAETANMGTA